MPKLVCVLDHERSLELVAELAVVHSVFFTSMRQILTLQTIRIYSYKSVRDDKRSKIGRNYI